jgi:hypothetical protein
MNKKIVAKVLMKKFGINPDLVSDHMGCVKQIGEMEIGSLTQEHLATLRKALGSSPQAATVMEEVERLRVEQPSTHLHELLKNGDFRDILEQTLSEYAGVAGLRLGPDGIEDYLESVIADCLIS